MTCLQRTLPILLCLIAFGAPQVCAQAPETPVRALVFEHPDKWTDGGTGAARLLREAGAVVGALDLDRRPVELKSDLVVFGSFSNNDKRYREFTTQHAADLRRFVAEGGVILVMTQSDQYGESEAFLPQDLAARRIDKDLARVVTQVDAHPLLKGWAPPRGEELTVPSYKNNELNWESFFEWRGFRVLMASHPGPAYPALLEGSHGKGRIILTSLWLDKVFDQDGQAIVAEGGVTAGRQFFKALTDYVRLVRSGRAAAVVPTSAPVSPPTGPVLGHIDAEQALVWYRPSSAGSYELVVTEVSTGKQTRQFGEARQEDDLCITWRAKGLRADTEYSYRILDDGKKEVVGGDRCRYQAALAIALNAPRRQSVFAWNQTPRRSPRTGSAACYSSRDGR